MGQVDDEMHQIKPTADNDADNDDNDGTNQVITTVQFSFLSELIKCFSLKS